MDGDESCKLTGKFRGVCKRSFAHSCAVLSSCSGSTSRSILRLFLLLVFLFCPVQFAGAHNLHGADGEYDHSVEPPEPVVPVFTMPSRESLLLAARPTTATSSSASARGKLIASYFQPFAKTVKVHWDGENFYVESNGIPSHVMMTGITSWQQQVPLPQPYYGSNAWQFPLFPRVASRPLSCKDNFFRGAIAIAVNGVPIFNPIKNDGRTDTYLAGELDKYGGHAGRADDYHYHIAPLHLQAYVGKNVPIAYALDGYPIYGATESDGSAVKNLDRFNGHSDASGQYHYHSTRTYPYINGGFHGEVNLRDDQVSPQPRAMPVRPFTSPLPGATITGFTRDASGVSTLTYSLAGGVYKVRYEKLKDGKYRFEYISADGGRRVETYDPNSQQRPRGGGAGGGPQRGGATQSGGPPGGPGPVGGRGGRPGERPPPPPRGGYDNRPPRPGS